LHEPVEDLLGDREAVDVADPSGVEGLGIVADRTAIDASSWLLRRDGSDAREEEAQRDEGADRGAGAPLSCA
jgi:hypothetical protein